MSIAVPTNEFPVKLKFLEARGIKPKDSKGGYRNPFVEFYVREPPPADKKKKLPQPKLLKTTVKDNTNDPVWNEEFTFSARADCFLHLTLFDWEKGKTKHTFMGEIDIPLQKYLDKNAKEWLEWKEKGGRKVSQGEMCFEITFGKPPSPPPPPPSTTPSAAPYPAFVMGYNPYPSYGSTPSYIHPSVISPYAPNPLASNPPHGYATNPVPPPYQPSYSSNHSAASIPLVHPNPPNPSEPDYTQPPQKN